MMDVRSLRRWILPCCALPTSAVVAHAPIGVAEEQAGITLDEVVVAVSSSRLQSTHFRAHIDLDAGHVRPGDLPRLTARARQFAERDGRVVGMSLAYTGEQHREFSDEPLERAAGRAARRMKMTRLLLAPLWRILETVPEGDFYLQAIAEGFAIMHDSDRDLDLCAVADVYDALTSKRVYKEAWSQEDTLAQVAEQSRAVAAAVLLRRRGLESGPDDAGFDPLLAAAPALIALAAGIVTLRLYAVPVRLLGWLAAKRRGMTGEIRRRAAKPGTFGKQIPHFREY